MGAPMPQTDFKVIGKTLNDLLVNERLLREIVAQFDLDVPEPRDYSGPWYISYYEQAKDFTKDILLDIWAILKYGRIPEENPTIEAVKRLSEEVSLDNQDSYVFYLYVTDTSPERVALLADAMAEKLVALATEAYLESAGNQRLQLETLLATKLEEIQDFQQSIDTLLAENKLISVSQELQEGVDELYTLQAEQRRLRADIKKETQTIEALGQRLASVDRTTGSADRLQPEDFNRMVSEKLFAEVELEGLNAQDAAFENSISALDSELKKLPALKLEIDQLESDISRAQREYEQMSVVIDEIVVLEGENAEFHIQHQAIEPNAPVSPIKVYHVGLAAFLSLFFAVGLVYLFTFFDVQAFTSPGGGSKSRGAEALEREQEQTAS